MQHFVKTACFHGNYNPLPGLFGTPGTLPATYQRRQRQSPNSHLSPSPRRRIWVKSSNNGSVPRCPKTTTVNTDTSWATKTASHLDMEASIVRVTLYYSWIISYSAARYLFQGRRETSAWWTPMCWKVQPLAIANTAICGRGWLVIRHP